MYYYAQNYRGDVAGVYQVVGNKLQCVQNLGYYPSGVLWSTSIGQSVQPYKYGEKELLEISGLDRYDNLARYYEPAIGRANSIDPHCEKYYSVSPYAWCGNNFVNIVDPNGLAWRAIYDVDEEGNETIIGYEWVDDEESYDDNGKLLEGLYEAVVWFQGSRDECPSIQNGSTYIVGDGAVNADVIVYGPQGADDIHNFIGYTMTSNPDVYIPINEDQFSLDYKEDGKEGKLPSHWALNNGGKVETMDCKPNTNPYSKKDWNYGTKWEIGIYIHSTGEKGRLGKMNSTGCLLILDSQWNNFNKVLQGVTKSKNSIVRVTRTGIQ